MVIAGEISGDMHAGAVIRELRRRRPELDVFGIGGDELAQAGMQIHYHARDMAVLGLTEVLLRIRFFRRVFREMLALARERRPNAVLLVDYPGFNLRFAEQAHSAGLKVIYYVCPQVWAWNRRRIPKIARIVDRLLTIFPFEADVFKNHNLRVDFVGHPLATLAAAELSAPAAELPWAGKPKIALLPGSRYHEIKRILPVLAQAAALLRAKEPNAGFIVAAPSAEVAGWVRNTLDQQSTLPPNLSVVAGKTRAILRQADAAWVASGTATIETALMNCPMIVVYRVAWATYWLGRMLIRVPHLGMVNLVAGRQVCPEFIQSAATPCALADALLPLLNEGPLRTNMLQELRRVRQMLGEGDAAARAAEIIDREL